MKLHAQHYRSPNRRKTPLVILHGLLGSLDNWHSFARRLSEHLPVHSLDARNHGRSPRSDEFDYDVMADDVHSYCAEHTLNSIYLLGHSMGGKTAMMLALKHPSLVERLIVVDIAPKEYEPHHDHIFDALDELDLASVSRRQQVDQALSERIENAATRQFLLKSLQRTDNGRYRWKFNLEIIRRHYKDVNRRIEGGQFIKPALFVRGQKSDYILQTDIPMIRSLFPSATIITISGAGHWVHADEPDAFTAAVSGFLSD
jgi:pimeloyl-ACP methyl ester carboxylesterase